MSNPNDTQIGGGHYKKATFQPWDWALERHGGLGHYEVSIIQYVTRFREKGGKQDLEKAMHYLDKIVYEAERGEYRPLDMEGTGKAYGWIEDYCQQNGCDSTQRGLIYVLIMWVDHVDLQIARDTIEALLDECEG